ncbi:MAG: outer membrane beta-barrel protein [Bradyrhizobium sp.]
MPFQKIIAAAVIAASTILGIGVASAADLRVKAPPPAVAAVYDWTGFYIGVNVGGVWGDYDVSASVPPAPPNAINAAAILAATTAGNGGATQAGFTGGGQVGYNRQFGKGLVVGVEADLSYLGDRTTRNTGVVPVGVFLIQDIDNVSHDWLATFRGRLGFATGPVLFYGTGGVALTNQRLARTQDWSFVDGCPVVASGLQRCHLGSVSETKVGWAVGAGVEYGFTPNWTVKGEYLHADFGSSSFTTLNVGPGFVGFPQSINHSVRSTVDIVRVGLNYRFGGPVVAKF